VTPGSEQIHATIERDGQMKAFQEMGATVLANACGPCIGQWNREDVEAGQPNSIITSYNRNFPKRNDGNVGTHAFIGSPEITTAIAFAGTLAFNPLTDRLTTPEGKEVKLDPPKGAELPAGGFVRDISGYVAPPEDGSDVQIDIDPGSERLEVLAPFGAPQVPDGFKDLTLLVKAAGKCTTDHISPAGPWLKYRGHLTNISQNLFIGVQSAFQTENGKGLDILSGERGVPLPDLAKRYKEAGKTWVIVGDANYGEGSSREHAAMEPRYMGCKAVIVRSFARIHETNLKRQGILPLRFARLEDYDKIQERDTLTIRGLDSLAPGKSLELEVRHEDGSTETVEVTHTMTEQQIGWFHAGSALNEIRSRTSG
jgi:aconitate hydratase